MSVARTAAPSPQATGAVCRSRSEIRALTGLRLVAAMWVVMYHFVPELTPYLDQVPGSIAVLSAGWIGVELFFVLSGFVIARGYLEQCGRHWSTAGAARFVANRFARVWPAWATVTLLACAWFTTADLIGLRGRVADLYPPIDVASLLRQLTMTQMWGADSLLGTSYVTPGWSISAEWAAYLAFPLLALVVRPFLRAHPAVNLVLATVVMSPLAATSFLHGTDDVEMHWLLRIACSFTAGMLAACAFADLEDTERGRRWGQPLVLGGLATVGVVLLWAHWRTGQDVLAGDHPGMYGAVAVVAWPSLVTGLASADGRLAAFLSRDPVVYGGRISYCLYLAHTLVKDVALGVIWHDPSAAGARAPGVVLVVPVLIVVSLLGAAALHQWVEEPARRRLVRLWSGRRAIEPSTARQTRSTVVLAGAPEPGPAPRSASRAPAPGRPWPLAAAPRPRTAPRAGRPADALLTTGGRESTAARG
ncbi:Peptidoglycan/LPS O-acetylase OafA/YrhL, contains acyltransferase and SGNH-hydrolase domains [Geodermatophilus obscurus]|uniref:Peptidoglycan/LPS O-acetylase OafA/YrhL, contains acyltransferase and SGNH-hydrolase domains n=1 Tax=Geodermatophilus obscurus TaxID=1861 RepID=A0A1M7UPS6_9ACTN|nr:acyltransferase [Geodermatophilus obscurus]SHN85021.1 Peptidoglycan/LPS O-acetylase OafA/YrhL, contains acyltransferase and SGNH-hydrolase domains [Geodermatophilus obscurus]